MKWPDYRLSWSKKDYIVTLAENIIFKNTKFIPKLTERVYMDRGAVCKCSDSDSDCRPWTRSVVRAFDSDVVMSDHGLGPTFCLGLGPCLKIVDREFACDVGLGPWSEAFDRWSKQMNHQWRPNSCCIYCIKHNTIQNHDPLKNKTIWVRKIGEMDINPTIAHF
ncbi:hypothetical protein LXL04_029339 [Taraxacum kok-saghyz]